MCVCLFSIEIQTPGWVGMKFGKEAVLEGRKILGFFLTWSPQGTGCIKGVWGAPGALAICFGKNFIKLKFQSALI